MKNYNPICHSPCCNVAETAYDYLMRLTSWTTNGDDTQSITYDATTGNIISKSDLGLSSEFSYDSSLKPHALRSVSGITNNWGSTDVSINYTDFGKVELIQRGGDSYSIFYGQIKSASLHGKPYRVSPPRAAICQTTK